MNKNILFITLFLLPLFSWGQRTETKLREYPIPKNIKQCFELLDKTMPEHEIQLIKTLQEDSIYCHPEFIYRAPKYGADFFRAWDLSFGSRLTKYFKRQGLDGYFEMYKIILVSYHRYLNNQKINLNEQVEKYRKIRQIEYENYIVKIEKDTINNIYIPKDLEDCFIQLDKLLSDEDKQNIKQLEDRKETIKFHHGLGTWIRNNWGLWGGSRLQRYFIEKNVTHPDAMSALILESYYGWLNNENNSNKNE